MWSLNGTVSFVHYWRGGDSVKKHVRTDAGPSHSLRPVAPWTRTVVAASGVLTDLVVSALVGSIPALIDVYNRQQTTYNRQQTTDNRQQTTDSTVQFGNAMTEISQSLYCFISVHQLILSTLLPSLTYTRPVGPLGHPVGTQVDTGVTTTCVFTLLIWATDPLSALVYIWGEKRSGTIVRAEIRNRINVWLQGALLLS